jgi:hypothetical protein
MQDKQKLINEKMALVWQLNALQEKLDSYPISVIVNDNWTFKDEANLRYRIELRIKEINQQLEEIEKATLSI